MLVCIGEYSRQQLPVYYLIANVHLKNPTTVEPVYSNSAIFRRDLISENNFFSSTREFSIVKHPVETRFLKHLVIFEHFLHSGVKCKNYCFIHF